jgi:hypothetical protein
MGLRAPDRVRPLLISVAVMVLGFLSAFADPAAGATQTSLAIFDDDGGRALFAGPLAMAPGRRYTQCLQIGARSADSRDMVRVGASDVSGDLAASLRLTIEIGEGGRFGDCAAFTGTELFTGTLDDLAAAGAGEGIATGWQPAAQADRSFRITAALDSGMRDQGVTAQGSFVWRLVDVTDSGQPPPGASPSLGQTPTPNVTVPGDGAATPGPGETDPAPSPSPTGASPTSGPTPSVLVAGGTGGTGDATGGSGRGSAPDLTIGGTLAQLGTVARQAQQAAAAVVTSPQYPLTAILLALGFLLIQDLIDRRDPKLAVAKRRQRDNEIDFPDRFHHGVGA